MKLLVTGGAGFIGSNFVRRLLNSPEYSNHEVVVLDLLTYAGNLNNLSAISENSKFKFIHGDICDSKLLDKLVAEVDAVINFAAESHVDRSIDSAEIFVNTNVSGVLKILDAILLSKKNVRFLQVSTDEVYGSIERGSWKEDSPLLPNSPYSASKASGELIAQAYHKTHGVDVVITRCSNNYGIHHHPEKLIPLFITNIIEGKKVPLYGNGSNVRDWLHVNDHCDAILAVLNNGKSGSVFNIGGGTELSNIEITRKILTKMKVNDSFIEYVEDRKGHDFRYSVDWSKIKTELGYSPKVDFEQGLEDTIDWYVKNKSWWKPLKKI